MLHKFYFWHAFGLNFVMSLDDDEALLASLLGDEENVENSAAPPVAPPSKKLKQTLSSSAKPSESKVCICLSFEFTLANCS
jgi:hypothetical protein